jgi:hypothetical protein
MMRRYSFFVAALLLAITSLVWAQANPQSRRPRYDPKTEVTVTGTIDDVQLLPGHHRGTGTHLILKTKSGTMEVHVGPTAYVEKQQFSFAKGDEIEVIGSQVKIASSDALLARQITKAGKTLSLRDQSGIPLWSNRARSGS